MHGFHWQMYWPSWWQMWPMITWHRTEGSCITAWVFSFSAYQCRWATVKIKVKGY